MILLFGMKDDELKFTCRMFNVEVGFLRKFIMDNNVIDRSTGKLVSVNKFCSAIVRGWIVGENGPDVLMEVDD